LLARVFSLQTLTVITPAFPIIKVVVQAAAEKDMAEEIVAMISVGFATSLATCLIL